MRSLCSPVSTVRTALLSSPMRLCLVSSHHNCIVALWVGDSTVTSAYSLAKRGFGAFTELDFVELTLRECQLTTPSFPETSGGGRRTQSCRAAVWHGTNRRHFFPPRQFPRRRRRNT